MQVERKETLRTVEEYWAIARRRRWWIFLPLFVCWVIVWAISWLLPKTYRSEALILVEQPQIPQQYVVPNVANSLQNRLQTMTQQILSRTRLQATIDRLGLYRQHRTLGLSRPRDAIEAMRRDINIELVRSADHPGQLAAFKISYSAGSPELAEQVNSELTSLFVDESLKSGQQQSENTTAFLGGQLASARSQLEEQEAKVRSFKAKHFGDLPSQVESNVQILTGLQTELDNNQRNLDGAKQQKLYLESLQQQYKMVRTNPIRGEASAGSPAQLDQELLDLRSRLTDARSRYTDDFPDVISLKKKINEKEALKKEIEHEIVANEKNGGPATHGGSTEAEELQYDPSAPMMQVRSQLKANVLEIQNYERRGKDIESQIAMYRSRLNMAPETEQELTDISRGYEESKSNYNSLLQKQNQSQLATSLEERQQGEQFRIVDPPSLPIKPSAPNHLRISLEGLVLGIAVGLGLAALIETANPRVWQESDLQGLVPGRVLVGIPHLGTEREERVQAVYRRLEIGMAAGMVLTILIGNVCSFYKG